MTAPSFRVTFIVNHAAFFVSHRLPIALRLKETGHHVSLVTGQAGSVVMEQEACSQLSTHHIAHSRVAFRSSSINPFLEFVGILGIIARLAMNRPDIAHCISPKGILYGGLAARVFKIPNVVFAVSGMGYTFTKGAEKSMIRAFIAILYRFVAKVAFGHHNKKIIVQNDDDRRYFIESGFAKADDIVLIAGSGVNLQQFANVQIERKEPIVLLPARLLVDKGVLEFVHAARRLKAIFPDWQFIIAGAADYENPTAISAKQAEAWQKEGVIEWLGHVNDMTTIYARASIICLPSYREGMPKALLEAAAAGCAVVTTDVIGCRDAIVPGLTGDLVPVRDVEELTAAIASLIKDKERRERYGRNGQKMAEQRFDLEQIVDQTIAVYNSLQSKN